MPRLGAHAVQFEMEVAAVALEKNPSAQGTQVAAPAALQVPAGHAKAEAEPAGQKKPAGQGPVQAMVESPVLFPNLPAGHLFWVGELEGEGQ